MVERLFTQRPDFLRVVIVLLAIIGLNALGAMLFVVDFRLPFALLIAAVGFVVAVENPLAGVALLIAGRITSTGANAWVRIGKINVDLFEPALALTLVAVMFHAVTTRRLELKEAPWRNPVIVLLIFQVLSLAWTTSMSEAFQDVVATGVLLTTTFVIMTFATEWKHVRGLLFVWIAASVMVSLASLLGVASPSTTTSFEMSSGSRAGGFGQHPNWFSMNLMYGVLVAFALAIIEKNPFLKTVLAGAGMLIFLAQMGSGSRGGTGSILIGAAVAAFFNPRIRKTMMKVGLVGGIIIAAVIFGDAGSSANAFARIWTESSSAGALGAGVRESNWVVCWMMFKDTWGLGIGGGGYEELLQVYNWWLYNSQYTYPHGIFWGMMAHYGLMGIGLMGWFLVSVTRMSLSMIRATAGRPEQILVFAMFGTMIGYFSWSFFEFLYDEKPFWEFLGIYTVLWAWTKTLPPLEGEGDEATEEVDDPDGGPRTDEVLLDEVLLDPAEPPSGLVPQGEPS